MNLPHALATLTRDVLAHWHPKMVRLAHVWVREARWDGMEMLRLKPCPYEPGHGALYGLDHTPIYYVDPDTYRRIHAHAQEEYAQRAAGYIRRLEDMMAPHVWQQLVPIGAPEHGERLRGPRGPDPFSATLSREELAKLYPKE